MEFIKALNNNTYLLYDGPMETRIEYNTDIPLESFVPIFKLIHDQAGQSALRKFYEQDIKAVQPYKLPLILTAPTWRANANHILKLGIRDKNAVTEINRACIQLVQDIKQQYKQQTLFVTAPIGPMLTDYQANEMISIDESCAYHSEQMQAIKDTGIDIISIAAMTGATETIGCAKAAAATGLPYSVGVVVNAEGQLMDGTTIKNLIQRLDETITPQPNFYVLSCTHPQTASLALYDFDPIYQRILGIKANGSSKPLNQLLSAGLPIADEPEIFADELVRVGELHHFKIYGGCCGTDDRHLAALAKKLASKSKR